MAKKKRGKKLTLRDIPAPVSMVDVVATVAVPEFGEDDDGNPLEVDVRPLTVLTSQILTKKVNQFVRDPLTGEYAAVPRADVDEATIIAAICSYGDDGQLVFGVDYDDAIARVEALPRAYRPAILRIAGEAIKLSAMVDGKAAAVEEAKKN